MRNAFLDAGIEGLWHHLLLRIAFFVGFGAAGIVVSRLVQGFAARRIARAAKACTLAFSVVAVASSATYYASGVAHSLAFDLVAWFVSGIGLGSLLFIWISIIARLGSDDAARSIALSIVFGAGMYLVVNLLPAFFGVALLALCPLASLGVLRLLEAEGEQPDPITYAESKKNARLSWSFGLIYVVYGVVFGLGAGSVTQVAADDPLFAGTAAFAIVGALSVLLFTGRLAHTVSQINVLRMLFPFLVVSLVAMSLFSGIVYILSNLLLFACYVFLVAISVSFETQRARECKASPLFIVGMSQSALSAGMVAGLGLGLLPSAAGVTDFGVLSAVALGLVVLLAAFVSFAPVRLDVVPENASEDEWGEGERVGHWRKRCAAVAEEVGLSPRETEVFLLLAKGRGTEYIQNKLCISGHTVKTHTYNIYRKMGIGSREELLDAIESGLDAGRD